MIFSLFLLFAFLFAGEVLKTALHLPLPGPVLGLILLLSLLIYKKGGPKHWSLSADFLLSHLALLFVPAGVGLMIYGPLLWQDFWGLGLVLVLGTALILVGSAALMQFLLRGPKS